MNEAQLHELVGRLTIQIEVLRLTLVEAQAKLAEANPRAALPDQEMAEALADHEGI